MTQTRSQRFAVAAFAAVENRSQLAPGAQKEYRSFARSFPTLLHTCGLAQAAAYAAAKGKHHRQVLDDVAATLQKESAVLLHESRSHELLDYVVLSRDTLQAAAWVKRYAEALLAGDSAEQAGDAT